MDSGIMNARMFDRIGGSMYTQDLTASYEDYFAREAAMIYPLLIGSRRVLDVGCGAGREFDSIAAFPDRIVAFDINSAEVVQARKKQYDNIDLAVADARELPFKDNTFDLVLMLYNVLGNSLDDKGKILAEANRVLEGGGYVALSTYAPNSAPFQLEQYMHWNMAQNYRIDENSIHIDYPDLTMESQRFTKSELIGLLRDAGFRPSVWKLNDFTFFASGRKR